MFMRIDCNFIVHVCMTYHIFVDFIDPRFISIDPNFQLIEMNGIDCYKNK